MTRTQRERYGRSPFRRTALAPGLLAAIIALAGVALVDSDSFLIIRYVLAIMALIIAWFTFQARKWWWLPILMAIAVVWNPVFPFEFVGPWWLAAQYLAALGFILVAIFVKKPNSVKAERVGES